MQTISINDIGHKMAEMIQNEDPIEEDIGIVNEKGELLGAFILKDAYEFFLKKIDEEEDELDLESVKKFQESGEKNNK